MLQVIRWFRWWGYTSRNTVFFEWLWMVGNRVFLYGGLVGWDRRWFLIRMSRNISQENTRKTRIKSRFFPPRPIENDKSIAPEKSSENYIFSPTFDQAEAGLESTGEHGENQLNSETVSLTNYFRIFAKNLNITKCYIMNTVLINSQFVHILKPCDTNTTQKIHCISASISCPTKP